MVGFQLNSQQWDCVPDENQCPGLGGYILNKCPGTEPTSPPVVEDADNFEGQVCQCENQLFMNADCSGAFQCGANWADNKGNLQQCPDPDNEVIS